jgi:beta-lactamase superfamily II metal-dependent hydrolase
MRSEEDSMSGKLVVRLYRVGFGDCIFVQIPDGAGAFNMLIDCGSSGKAEPVLRPAVEHICSQLPKGQDNKHYLDLLVVTHPHADHIKGFDPAWFQDVTVGRIWMTAFMEPTHPQAQKAQAFEKTAFEAAKALLATPGLHFTTGAQTLLDLSLSLNNTGALSALRQGLRSTNPRLYVARDKAARMNAADRAQHALSMELGVTTFRGFQEAGTCLRVLAPEWDIDGTYLGQSTAGGNAFLDNRFLHTQAYADGEASLTDMADGTNQKSGASVPANISARDFRLLRSRFLFAALAFSQDDDDLKNNTSAVLLLEWRGKRLLFTGDAEWDGGGLQAGERNSSWDVMLDNPDVKALLLQPLDVFKVAHHGSINGSPFERGGAETILPKLVKPERTQVVISTVPGVHPGKQNPVPYPPLLRELGKLAQNKTVYEEGEAELRQVHQPQRTDLESDSTEAEVDYLEVTL